MRSLVIRSCVSLLLSDSDYMCVRGRAAVAEMTERRQLLQLLALLGVLQLVRLPFAGEALVSSSGALFFAETLDLAFHFFPFCFFLVWNLN